MRFWRKKSQGFDWHSYVRTTILVRREKRKAKLDQIKAGAVDGAAAVGKAALAGAEAGVRDVGRGLNAVVDGAKKGGAKIATPIAQQAGRAGVSLHDVLARPGFALPLILCGGIAIASGLYRYFAMPGETALAFIPLAVGTLLLLLSIPSVRAQFGFENDVMPDRVRRVFEWGALPALAALMVAGGYFWIIRGKEPMASASGPTQWLSSVAGGFSSAKAVEGRSAGVVSGDALRLQGNVFRLSGVEAPDRQQVCGSAQQPAKRWKCGEAAQAALERFVKTKAIRCVPFGAVDAAGQTEARCEAEGVDIAGEMVRQGYVFSTSLYFGGYAGYEAEARTQQRGVWSGEIERPADYRARIWEMAKRASPDGCPIKGQVTSSGKTYVLPWSVDYSRTTIKTQKGERWFCSEDEAIAAGWKAARRG